MIGSDLECSSDPFLEVVVTGWDCDIGEEESCGSFDVRVVIADEVVGMMRDDPEVGEVSGPGVV